MLSRKAMPMISSELVDVLEQVFPQISIEPSTELPDIMYNAGQRFVLDWLRRNIKESTTDTFEIGDTR